MTPAISYKTFLANCKKDIPRTRVYYTYVYHQVTYPLSYLLYRLSFTANSISILGIIISLVGGVLIFMDWPILGTFLFLFSYLLDCCDGNVARIHYGLEGRPRGDSQSLGMLLENFYPNVSYPLFFISIGTYIFHQSGLLFFVWIAVAASVIKLVNRYTVLHASHMRRAEAVKEGRETNREVFTSGWSNELKYFVVRVLDSARLYYVIFLAVLIIFPTFLSYVFVTYMVLIIFLNTLKIFKTLISRMP
jgi:hypothetical protein